MILACNSRPVERAMQTRNSSEFGRTASKQPVHFFLLLDCVWNLHMIIWESYGKITHKQ